MTKPSLVLFFVFSVLIFFSNPAFTSDDVEPLWEKIGDWSIHVDRSLDFGCFIMKVTEDNSVVRFGWNPVTETAYLILGNYIWRSIEDGKSYDVKIQFDDLSPWFASASGTMLGGVNILWIEIDDSKFLVEMAERHFLKVYYQGKIILETSLRDSHLALKEMLTCQNRVDEVLKDMDPFDDSRNDFKRQKDPFAY